MRLKDHSYHNYFEISTRVYTRVSLCSLQKIRWGPFALCCVCVHSYKHILFQLLEEVTALFTPSCLPHHCLVMTHNSCLLVCEHLTVSVEWRAPAATGGHLKNLIHKIQTNCGAILADWNQTQTWKISRSQVWHVECWRWGAKHDILQPGWCVWSSVLHPATSPPAPPPPQTSFTSQTSHPRAMMMSSSPPPDKLLSGPAWIRGGVNCKNCIPLRTRYACKSIAACFSWRWRHIL